MARTPQQLAADLSIGFLCLLRLLALWVLFLIYLPFQWSFAMFAKLKKARLSKTILVNVAIAAAAAAPGVIEAVGPLLGENAAAKALGAVSLLNILLRLVTKVPVAEKQSLAQ